MRYAQINETGLCVGISDLSGPVSSPNMIPIADDENPLGMIREKGKWKAAPVVTQPALLTKLGFIELCQSAGGMSDAQLIAARNDPAFGALWIKLDLATDVNKSHPATTAGLTGLNAAGYLPKGVKAVLSAWPEV